MTVKDLIKNKDYDYISFRITAPEWYDKPDIFFGACKAQNGKLIPLDDDSYSEDEEVIRYEEWSSNKIQNGLTIVVESEWN